MKKLLKIILTIVIVYVVAVALLRAAGDPAINTLPEFIDFMPQIIDAPGGEGSNAAKTLYQFKLCPFSEAVY